MHRLEQDVLGRCAAIGAAAFTVVAFLLGGCGGGGSVPEDAVQPYFTASSVGSGGSCSGGCAIEGQRLSVTPGVWANGPTSFSYQWQDCTTSGPTSTGTVANSGGGSEYVMNVPTTGSCSNASGGGATTNTYTVGASDVGHSLAVRVTATNSGGSTSTSVSGACDTGLANVAVPNATNDSTPPSATYPDNGQPGCSPISAVVGTGQYGTGASGEHICTNAPVTCGLADIANTGPPAGTTLYAVPGTCTSPSGPGSGCGNTGSGWSYSGNTIHLTSGATLKDVSYRGSVSISDLSNVTIEDSDLSTSVNDVIDLFGASSNITIENNDLTGLDAKNVGDGCADSVRDDNGQATNVTVANNNMWYCAAPLNNIVNGWTIDTNYIHDFSYAAAGNHMDGIQFEGGGNGQASPFYNNTLMLDNGQCCVIILSDDNQVAETNRQIVHNLVAGGDYCMYVAGTNTYPTVNSTFENNIFSSIYFSDASSGAGNGCSGYWGDVAYWTSNTNTWTENLYDYNGATVSP